MSKRLYVVMDERAMFDPDDAVVLVASGDNIEEARRDAKDFAPCVIMSYAETGKKKGGIDLLEDERFEEYVSIN